MALTGSVGVNQSIGFGMTFYLDDQFTRVAQNIGSSMGSLDAMANTYSNSIRNSFQQGFNMIGSGAATVATSLATLLPLGYGLKIAGEFEAVQIQLETLLKSKEVAASFFEDLKKDALVLPMLGFKDLAKGSGYLIAAGVAAQTAREDLNNFAKSVMAVGGSKDAFNRMAYNLSQVKNQGKATGLDMRQFAQANLPIGMYLNRVSGKRLNDKNITYDDLTKAFALFAKENDVTGAMMNSIVGQTAMLKENFEYLFAGIGKAITPNFVSITQSLNSLLQTLTAFVETPVGKFTVKVISMAMALTSLIGVAFGVSKIFLGLKRVIATFAFSRIAPFMTQIKEFLYYLVNFSIKDKIGLIFSTLAKRVFAVYIPLMAMYKLLQSNSGAAVTLGVAMSFLLGKVGILGMLFMMFSRAYSAWNDFISGKNKNLEGLSGFFIRFGGIMAGVLAIMNGLNEEGWVWSAEIENQLRDAGVLELVTNLGTLIYGISSLFRGIADFFGTSSEGLATWIGILFIFGKVTAFLGSMYGGAVALGGVFGGWAAIWTTIAGWATTFWGVIVMIGEGVVALITGIAFLLALPFEVVAGVIALIVAVIALVIWKWDYLVEKIMFGINYLKEGLLSIFKSISDGFSYFVEYINGDPHPSGNNNGYFQENDPTYNPYDTGYIERNYQDMRDLKSYQYKKPNDSEIGNSFSQTTNQQDLSIILQMDGYELHRQLVKYGEFDTARS